MNELSTIVLIVVCMSVSAAVTWWIAAKPQSEGEQSGVSAVAKEQPANVSNADTDVNVAEPGSIEAIKQTIQQRFTESRPELIVDNVEPSAIAGLYAVEIQRGPTLYVTADGSYFVMGDMFQSLPGGFVNIAEKAREGDRATAMAALEVSDMIVFAPKAQPSKAVINVFTDVDCYYCQKLHNEVPDLNRVGIEVRYLAFPRAGVGSASYNKIVSAWCADDQQTAITKLKRRENIAEKLCEQNPVKDQYMLGQKIGVSGTPALVTEQGRLMPGYVPTLQLAQALGVEVAPDITAELMQKQTAQKN